MLLRALRVASLLLSSLDEDDSSDSSEELSGSRRRFVHAASFLSRRSSGI